MGNHILIIILVITLTGCTTTPEGKSMERSHRADMATTAWGLAITDLSEANPLGYWTIPIRMGLNKWVDNQPCSGKRKAIAEGENTATYYVVGQNFAVIAGLATPGVGGIIGMLAYISHKKNKKQTTSCFKNADGTLNQVAIEEWDAKLRKLQVKSQNEIRNIEQGHI